MLDYDLVIIGGGIAGRYAAATAVTQKARVALVEFGVTPADDALYSRSLLHYSQRGDSWEDAIAQAHHNVATFTQENSLDTLAILGVDVIRGQGEFCRLPQQAFIINHRRLRSRSYLLATGSRFTPLSLSTDIPLKTLTPPDLWQISHLETLPDEIVILGSRPLALEIAQILTRFGKKVTLAVADSSLLPLEDPEIVRWLQAHLEAQGIQILTHSPINQVQIIDNQPWLQLGDTAIEASCVIVASETHPHIEGLNLAGVGIKLHQKQLLLNEKLQTANRQIYACGSLGGGYAFPHLAQAEATVALKNALFWARFKMDYRPIPWAIFTEPNFAAVGLSEVQARRRYGKHILVIRHFFKQNAQAIITEANDGFIKLILHENGEILGARILGRDGADIINLLALGIQQRLKIQQLAKLSAIAPSLGAILPEAAIAYQQTQSRSTLPTLRQEWYRFCRRFLS
ncbi:MAG: NAD(P)/FAD-dependent oxidoreductase [Jaaginema sp. PMC 1079.18]|nr:NAD(P)/FAD-dependent oxidoreductase [Jaaginema sp. PMC 1080.18]MEC4851504.1 NAD(P)/FAD-dependent oxidoreductase [Jaaginema sp. PMC 1079.18]MEC4864730.1 NAD(P)/FAD-dependent oxidoreductase [Jaaginema sp. PMC 1078.18]